jgi:hypothetical protein
MSEMAPERPAKRGNVFTNKIGPLPMWAWLVIAAGIVIGFAWYKSKSAGSAAAASTTSASQVPDFINQTYTSTVPPTVPVPDNDKAEQKQIKALEKQVTQLEADEKKEKKPPPVKIPPRRPVPKTGGHVPVVKKPRGVAA